MKQYTILLLLCLNIHPAIAQIATSAATAPNSQLPIASRSYSLHDCMEYAIAHSAKMEIQRANNDDARMTGHPISPDSQEQIFIPFFTPKSEDSGIGLSLSRQIMRLHNGSIRLVRSNEKGTVFTLVFR